MRSLLALLLLAGCTTVSPQRYASTQPRLELEKYFAGRAHSQGVFESRSADPQKRFRVQNSGHLQNGALVLDQRFAFDDGSTQERHWRIRRLDAHRYEATANDIVGQAIGQAYGNTVRLDYTIALQPGNPLAHVRVKQWLYLQADGRTLFTRGVIQKLGLQVAQFSEVIVRD